MNVFVFGGFLFYNCQKEQESSQQGGGTSLTLPVLVYVQVYVINMFQVYVITGAFFPPEKRVNFSKELHRNLKDHHPKKTAL